MTLLRFGACKRGSGEQAVISSLQIVRRTLETDIAYTLCRMKVLERLAGNPIGLA